MIRSRHVILGTDTIGPNTLNPRRAGARPFDRSTAPAPHGCPTMGRSAVVAPTGRPPIATPAAPGSNTARFPTGQTGALAGAAATGTSGWRARALLAADHTGRVHRPHDITTSRPAISSGPNRALLACVGGLTTACLLSEGALHVR